MIESNNSNSGIGTGEAQVFKPTDSQDIYRALAYKTARNKEKAAKQQGIYGTIGKIKEDGIFEKHDAIFAKKQQELYDYTKQNIKKLIDGDPNATIDWQQKVNQLEQDVKLSSNIKKNYDTFVQDALKPGNKFREESKDYLNDFTGYDEKSDTFYAPDPTKMKVNISYDDHIKKDLQPSIVSMVNENEKGGNTDRNGKNINWTSKSFTLNQANQAIADDLKDPIYFEQVHHDWDQDPEKNKYTDPIDYAQKKYASKLVINGYKETGSSGSGDSYTDEDISTNPQQINYKTQNFSDPEKVDASTFTTVAKVTHKTPVKVNISLNKDIVPYEGDLSVKESGVVDMDLGETMVVPVYKPGTTQKNSSGKKSLAGSVIPDHDFAGALKDGKVEYKVMVSGQTKDKDGTTTDYMVPGSQVQGALKKKGVPYEKLQQQADKLNSNKPPTASRGAWKKAGWSDAQIDSGIKSGKIQVN